MTPEWTPTQLRDIARTRELQIATRRDNGVLRRLTPVWVVVADSEVYVRTWYRRSTGWYGRAIEKHSAHIESLGGAVDVAVVDVGDQPADLRELVDAAYREKYGSGGHRSMVSDEAAATTLRLSPLSDVSVS